MGRNSLNFTGRVDPQIVDLRERIAKQQDTIKKNIEWLDEFRPHAVPSDRLFASHEEHNGGWRSGGWSSMRDMRTTSASTPKARVLEPAPVGGESGHFDRQGRDQLRTQGGTSGRKRPPAIPPLQVASTPAEVDPTQTTSSPNRGASTPSRSSPNRGALSRVVSSASLSRLPSSESTASSPKGGSFTARDSSRFGSQRSSPLARGSGSQTSRTSPLHGSPLTPARGGGKLQSPTARSVNGSNVIRSPLQGATIGNRPTSPLNGLTPGGALHSMLERSLGQDKHTLSRDDLRQKRLQSMRMLLLAEKEDHLLAASALKADSFEPPTPKKLPPVKWRAPISKLKGVVAMTKKWASFGGTKTVGGGALAGLTDAVADATRLYVDDGVPVIVDGSNVGADPGSP